MVNASASLDLLKTAGKDFMDDDCMTMGAAIAYYTVFALPPLLAILVAVAGWVFGAEAVTGSLSGQVSGLIGPQAAEEVETMIANASQSGSSSIWATVLGAITLLFGASGAFGQLQTALNRAWEIKPDPAAGGIKQFVSKRLLSFGMVMTIAFLLVVSLGVSAALTAASAGLEAATGGPVAAFFVKLLNLVVSFGVVTALFAALFKVLPDAEITWRDVGVGAAVTAGLFVVGKWAIGFYLGTSDPGSAFGAAGSLAVILVWIYYTSLILLFGAEFTQVWAARYGSRIEPDEDAVRVVEEEVVVEEGHPKTKQAREERSPHARPEPAPADEGQPADAERKPAAHPWAEPRDPEPYSKRHDTPGLG